MDETRFIEILKPVSYLYIVVDCIVMCIICVFIIAILPNISSSSVNYLFKVRFAVVNV